MTTDVLICCFIVALFLLRHDDLLTFTHSRTFFLCCSTNCYKVLFCPSAIALLSHLASPNDDDDRAQTV
jgi:hypothetical protein